MCFLLANMLNVLYAKYVSKYELNVKCYMYDNKMFLKKAKFKG